MQRISPLHSKRQFVVNEDYDGFYIGKRNTGKKYSEKKMPDISQLVQQIALSETSEDKMALFNRLTVRESLNRKNEKIIAALLYDEDANIRKEAAYFLESTGAELKGTDYLQYRFALQDFELFLTDFADNEKAREILFYGFKDKNLRVRAKILRHVHEKDCRTQKEKILYYYGRTDYETLADIYFEAGEEDRVWMLALIKEGTKSRKNQPYHRRQCALLLEKLKGSEDLSEPIRELLKVKSGGKHDAELIINRQMPAEASPLTLFIDKLHDMGILINGTKVFPEIHIGQCGHCFPCCRFSSVLPLR